MCCGTKGECSQTAVRAKQMMANKPEDPDMPCPRQYQLESELRLEKIARLHFEEYAKDLQCKIDVLETRLKVKQEAEAELSKVLDRLLS